MQALRVNFISNLGLDDTSGGGNGRNVAMHQSLSEYFALKFVGPISPASDYPAKVVSKLRRVNGRPGSFHFFSERRLRKIAGLVAQEVDQHADCDFFHGSTPWILYNSPRPYFVNVDTCFSTYVDVYHEREKFSADDIKRICDLEAEWLSRAERVFFGTQWALEKAVTDYGISRSNLSAVGAGGSMTPPDIDRYDGGMNFLFIALDFERKGGHICVEAFSKVRRSFPNACLTLIGERPPTEVLNLPGVSYEGFLRKSESTELRRLEELYATAFALVHPTSSDIQPLVISEAGYYGCPSIATKSFGIPELINDRVTGFLIETPLTADAFASRMLELCENNAQYLAIRKAVRSHTTANLTWPAVGKHIVSVMKSTVNGTVPSLAVPNEKAQAPVVRVNAHRLRLNFISNLALSERSGGWSGINVAIHEQLAERFDVNFVGPINPGNDYPAKVVSKLQRINGRPGAFHFFSPDRLKRISRLLDKDVDKAADCDFFHGQTPWILYEPERPYFVYTDACFSTYIDVYHERAKFISADLKRICDGEARWLSRATRVFFGTQWALDRAVSDYQIPRSNLSVVGAGGSMTPPHGDRYAGGIRFLFVALDFERKGGRICSEAFGKVHATIPDASLTIVGERPPDAILSSPGIRYEGLLRKSMPVELGRLEELYANAFMLVHPTSSDIQPLVISEAGYYGCPAIASRSFGIPELVEDGVTGLLVDTPITAEAFADRMLRLCEDNAKYLSMRRAVRTHATQNLTWNAVGQRIFAETNFELRCKTS